MHPIHAVRTRRPPRPASILAAFALAGAFGIALGPALAGRLAPAAAQPASPAITPTPSSPGGTQVMLPAIGPPSIDPACRTSIHVQLAGNEKSKVVLLTWGAPGACPSEGATGAAGPLGVECSGLMVPGGDWVFADPPVFAAARSGAIFSFTAEGGCWWWPYVTHPAADGAASVDCDDVTADLMCEELFFGVRGDAEEYQRFKRQLDTGTSYRGIPLDRAWGSPIVAWVDRTCPGPGGADSGARAVYAGVPGTAFGDVDPADGRFAYPVPDVAASGAGGPGGAGSSGRAHVQNAGSECAAVEVYFSPAGAAPGPDCAAATIRCASLTIVPGESAQLGLAQACGVTDAAGALTLRSTAPLAVAVDSADGGTGGAGTASDLAAYSTSTRPGPALAAPLLVDTAGGWRARLKVQNADHGLAAIARVTVFDAQGEPVLADDLSLCPGGGAAWAIDLPAGLPGPFVGSLSVMSQVVATPGGSAVPVLTGEIVLARAGDGNRAGQAAAYALAQAGDIAAGRSAGTGVTDVGAVVMPMLTTRGTVSGRPNGATSSLAIANTVGAPGSTELAILLFDSNGYLDHKCRTLGAKEALTIDLAGWGLGPGFRGSGVVSATAWNHPVAGADGTRNAVGLAAVVIEPIPGAATAYTGDTAVAEGIGLAPGMISSGFEYAHRVVLIPDCPGDPRLVPPTPRPTETPAPTRTPRPTATRTPRPILNEHVFLPLVFKARVGRR